MKRPGSQLSNSLSGRRVPLRVLAYHAIADHGGDRVMGSFSVPPDVFARHLDSLLRRGYHFIDGDQLLRYLWTKRGLPRKPILLTFDDCYQDLLDVSLPLLEARGIPAVAFAVAGRVGSTNDWDEAKGAARTRLLDAAGLREVAARGVEIGAHGTTHRPLVDVAPGELATEISGALDDLEAMGLPRPRLFAYPYGACNFEVFQATVGAGLLAAFSVRPGIVDPDEGHFLLPRIVVFREDRGWRFHWKLASVVHQQRWARARAAIDRVRRGGRAYVRRIGHRLARDGD